MKESEVTKQFLMRMPISTSVYVYMDEKESNLSYHGQYCYRVTRVIHGWIYTYSVNGKGIHSVFVREN